MRIDKIKIFIRWWALGVALLILLAGCGRTSMQAECDVDEDCGDGQICVNGFCDVEDTPDVGDAGHGCVDDLDCGDGICVEGEEGCVGDICNVETGECEVAECVPDCGPNEQEIACRCIPDECSDNDDCQGRICDGGVCRPCASDAECSHDGTQVCDGGFCGPGPDCVDDDDCPPHQRCGSEHTCVERPECTLNSDCPAEDEQCIAGTCTYTPKCEDDGDCSEYAECVGGECQRKMCRGSEDCEDDEICDAGECVPPPVALYCEVVTPSQTIVPNEQIGLDAFAYDEFGNSVAAQFSWSSSNEQVGEIDGNSIVGGTSPGTTTVSAVLQGGDPVACEGEAVFENLGLSPEDDLRVRVEDMETGQGLSGAEVFAGGESGITDANGVVYLPDPGGAYDVSVFHDDYNYLTVKGLEASDIRLPVSVQTGTGPVAGFTGEFNTAAISTSGDIELGLAGASLAGDLLDVNLERLLGDTFYTEFDLGPMGPGDDFVVPLPGGVTASGGFAGFQVDGKQRYYAQGADGPRLAWGMAGELPLMDMLDIFADPPTDVGSAIGEFLPLFSRFDHGQHSLVMEALPRVQDTQDINNSGDTSEMLPDYNSFPEVDLMPSVRQQLTSSINISSLPVLDGAQAEVAVLLGGTHLNNLGLIPLGISATNDEDGDGQPEARTIYMAPPYGAATGGRYVVMAIAFANIEEGGGMATDFSVALWNGETFQTQTSLGTFPDSSSGSIDEGSRTVTVDEATAGPIFRVRHVDAERSWDVWSQGPPGEAGLFSHQVTIPSSPDGWSDPFVSAHDIFVDSIRITDVSMDDLVRSAGVGLDRAGIVTTSFNRTTYR